MSKIGAYEIFIYNTDVSYLPLSEMGHTVMLHLKLKKFFSIKIPIWD